jgi:hypothetical protein
MPQSVTISLLVLGGVLLLTAILEGAWYSTDVCGSVGYIHRGQLKF